jgi:cephalosporin hydroxylase
MLTMRAAMTAAQAPQQAQAFLDSERIPWVQRFELAPGVVTPGTIDVAHQLAVAGMPTDLTGQTVLDVGTLNGAIAFEAERRGAERVIAVGLEPATHYGFSRIAALLGSRVEYLRSTVYELPQRLDEPADLTTMMSGLHHLRHPLLALDALREMTGGLLLFESAVSDQVAFNRHDDLGGDASNWFTPSVSMLVDWCGSAGLDAETVEAAPEERPESCIVRAKRMSGAPEFEQISPERRLRAAPASARAGLPPRVEADLDAPAQHLWRDRVRQSLYDSYVGVPLAKMPEALGVYEHLLWMSRPDVVIEIGVYRGASALWFRDRLRTLAGYIRGAREPRVIAIDIEIDEARAELAERDPDHARTIELLAADVCDPDLPDRVAELLPPGSRCMVIEDSAHTYDTTLAALKGFARFVPRGGFFVVEDGYVDVPQMRVDDDWPRGVLPAIDDWAATEEGQRFRRRPDLELYGLSNHPDGILQRTRT